MRETEVSKGPSNGLRKGRSNSRERQPLSLRAQVINTHRTSGWQAESGRAPLQRLKTAEF